MIKEVRRGEGMTQLIDWPEEMQIQRIHVRRRYRVEESPLDDFAFILGIILFTVMLCFGVVILQASEMTYIVLLVSTMADLMYLAYRAGKKRGR